MKSLKEFKEQSNTEQLDEAVMYSSAFRLSPSGRKVRAHRFNIGDKTQGAYDIPDDAQGKTGLVDDGENLEATKDKDSEENKSRVKKEEYELIEDAKSDLPFTLLLKRKAFRLYPNGMKIALYHNEKLNKYFSVPYSTDKNVDGPIQAEEVEYFEEGKEVMDHIHDIVREKQARKVKFANGKTAMVDGFTASAIKQVHDAVNDENKAKIKKMVHHSPEQFHKIASFAFSKTK